MLRQRAPAAVERAASCRAADQDAGQPTRARRLRFVRLPRPRSRAGHRATARSRSSTARAAPMTFRTMAAAEAPAGPWDEPAEPALPTLGLREAAPPMPAASAAESTRGRSHRALLPRRVIGRLRREAYAAPAFSPSTAGRGTTKLTRGSSTIPQRSRRSARSGDAYGVGGAALRPLSRRMGAPAPNIRQSRASTRRSERLKSTV